MHDESNQTTLELSLRKRENTLYILICLIYKLSSSSLSSSNENFTPDDFVLFEPNPNPKLLPPKLRAVLLTLPPFSLRIGFITIFASVSGIKPLLRRHNDPQHVALTVLVSRMKYYPFWQAICRFFSAWNEYEDYRYSTPAISALASMSGPSLGVCMFIVFLVSNFSGVPLPQ